MKINWFTGNKKSNAHDWVLPYFKSPVKFSPDPYLWTRIKARLTAPDRLPEPADRWFQAVSDAVHWALPLILLITISFGIYIGFELSNDFHQFYHSGETVIHPLPDPTMELMRELDLDKQMAPLSPEILDE